MLESRISAGATEKIARVVKTSRKDGGVVLRHARTCSKMRGYIVNWRTKRQRNCTKFQILAWMIKNSRRRNWNRLESCQKYALKLS